MASYRRSFGLPLGAILIELCFRSTAAAGDGTTKVVVFPVVPLTGEVEAGPAKEMTAVLLEEFGLQRGLSTIEGKPPNAAVGRPDTGRQPARSEADYRTALADLQEGARLAQRLRFPQAIRHLSKGVSGLTRNLEILDDYNRLIEGYLLLSVAHFRRGKEAAGTDVLEQVARLRPDLQLDPNEYPPMFLTIWDRTRERTLSRDLGSVRITSAPEGGDVIFNGRSLGKTPLKIDSVCPGENHVVVRLAGRAWAKVVEVRAGQTIEVHANQGGGDADAPVTMGDAIAANRFDREVRKAAQKLAEDMGGEFVVVLAIGRGSGVFAVGGFLGEVRSRKWATLEPVAPDFDMLSASIEAHSLAREVSSKISTFRADTGDETLAFITGKTVGSGKRGKGLKEEVVKFIGGAAGDGKGAGAVARAPAGTRSPLVPDRGPAAARGPVTASRGPVVKVETAPLLQPGGVTIPTEDEPEPAPEPEPEPEPERVVKEPGTDGGGVEPDARVALLLPDRSEAGDGRGPVVTAKSGELEPTEAERDIEVILEGGTAVAAVEGGAGTGPLAPDLEAEAEAAAGGSMIEKWWFWVAVGFGAAAVAAGTVAIIVAQQPSNVQVIAEWQ